MSSKSGKVFTLSWKIKNYSSCSLKMGEKLLSPVISVEKLLDTKWCLELYPQGNNKSDGKYISVMFKRSEKDENKYGIILTCFKLEMTDPNGGILQSREFTTFAICTPGYTNGYNCFCEIDELKSSMKSWKEDTLEFHFIAFAAFYKELPVHYKAVTEILVQQHLLNWEITLPVLHVGSKKVDCSFINDNLPISSGKFDVTVMATERKINIKIGIPKKQQLHKLGKLKLSISNKKEEEISMKNFIYAHEYEQKELELSFEKRQLFDYLTSSYSFNLICTINLQCGITSHSYENIGENATVCEKIVEQCQKIIPNSTLQEDIKDMFVSNKYCDVKLRVGSETIQAHKCLLSARSPVFATMFDQEMVESKTGIVDVVDCESGTLKSFLEFLYTDAMTTIDCQHILKVMLVADKYQFQSLKEKCSKLLMPELSLDNVYEVISVADMVNQFDLKLFALDYIKANKKSIISSPYWSEWMKNNMALGIEILTKLSLE